MRNLENVDRRIGPVRIDRQIRIRIQRLPHRGDHLYIMRDIVVADTAIICVAPRRQRINIELDRRKTPRLDLFGLRRISRRRLVLPGMAIIVHTNFIAKTPAQQLPNRHPHRLPGDIPQRHLDPTDCAHHRPLIIARRRHALHHIAKTAVDIERIFPDQCIGQPLIYRNLMHTRPMIRLPNPHNPIIRLHLHQHPRHRLQQYRSNFDDFHNHLPV